ncbi:MAG TPA: hypothetical protein VNM47_19250 [Terriglobia bacterium]|nr:hypothetical protein [Terriglobia bacterium]
MTHVLQLFNSLLQTAEFEKAKATEVVGGEIGWLGLNHAVKLNLRRLKSPGLHVGKAQVKTNNRLIGVYFERIVKALDRPNLFPQLGKYKAQIGKHIHTSRRQAVRLLIGLPRTSQVALALSLDSLREEFLSPLGGILREGYYSGKPDDS